MPKRTDVRLRLLSVLLALVGLVCIAQQPSPVRGQIGVLGCGQTNGKALLYQPCAAGAATSNCASVISSLGANMIGCWDADVGVALSGSNVLTWTDQSSNGYVLGLNAVLSEPAPTSPVFSSSSYGGKAGITCTAASAEYLATTISVAFGSVSTASFFAAVKFSSSSASFGRIISTAPSGGNDFAVSTGIAAILRDGSNQAAAFFFNGGEGTPYSITYNTSSRLGIVFDGVNGIPYLNNVAQTASAAVPSLGTNNISMCDGAGSSSGFMDGTLRRIVVTKNAASTPNRNAIDTFLSN